jgi:uncharacterized membrane protein
MALINQATRRFDGLERPRFRSPLALVAVLVLAAVNFGWQLGSSSYYVDEVLSLNTSLTPLSGLVGVVEARQLSPPGFYLFQHEWLYRANDHIEWVARLPSLVCGVALVAAIYWLAGLVSERSAIRLGAAALAAVSPFVLQFSQLAELRVRRAGRDRRCGRGVERRAIAQSPHRLAVGLTDRGRGGAQP